MNHFESNLQLADMIALTVGNYEARQEILRLIGQLAYNLQEYRKIIRRVG